MKYNSYSSNGSGIKVISGAIATIILGGIVLMKECTPVYNNAAIVIEEEEVNSDKKIKFKAGEHIISTSIFTLRCTPYILYICIYSCFTITVYSNSF